MHGVMSIRAWRDGAVCPVPLICTIAIAFTNYSSTNQLAQSAPLRCFWTVLIRQARPSTLVCILRVTNGN